jgi:hypothetical protein
LDQSREDIERRNEEIKRVLNTGWRTFHVREVFPTTQAISKTANFDAIYGVAAQAMVTRRENGYFDGALVQIAIAFHQKRRVAIRLIQRIAR